MTATRLLGISSLLFLLAACGHGRGGYYEDDGPHASPPVDVSQVLDAVPRIEPRSRSGNSSYSVFGTTYQPLSDTRGYSERGVASWYGKKFHGRRTSSGEPYDMYAMTAAHRTLPLPSYVRVTNLQNGRSVVVRVNDRGPFLHNRLIDLSYAAASRLGILGTGTGLVEVTALEPGTSTQLAGAAPEAPAVPSPATSTAPLVQIIPPAEAATTPPAEAILETPKLYIQVGAFRTWDNAVNLRTRLERAGFRPIFIDSVLLPTVDSDSKPERLYRVRIGPLKSVADGDRLASTVGAHGVSNPMMVVE